jgi:phosphoglycerol transferase MdoB-like AlkP superfamily enzyme
MDENLGAPATPQRPPAIDPTRSAPGEHRELLVTIGVATLFAILMMAQERQLLMDVSDGGILPYLSWRALVPLAVIAFSVLLPVRSRFAFLGASGALWALVVVGDAFYFRFFGSVTSLASTGSVHQLWDVRESVAELARVSDLLYVTFFGCLMMVAALPRRLLVGEKGASRIHHRLVASVILASVVGLMSVAAWYTPIYEDTHHIGRDKWVLPADHWGSRFSHATYAATFGLYNYHLNDLIDSMELGRDEAPLTDAQIAALDEVVADKQALNTIDTPFSGIAAGRRVVVIQLEAIMHWLIGIEVDGTPAMPFLTKLASQGLSWDYVMDVTAMGRTSDAEFAVMTGLLPDTTRPNSFAHPDRAPRYLPRTLKNLGYRTASYHGYKKSFWNRSYTHPVYGIDEMYFDESYDAKQILGLGVPDGVVYDFLLDRIEQEAEEGDPSFSFVISLSSHHPFVYTPAEYNQLFPSMTLENGWGLMGPYLRSARFTDDALAGFFEGMRKRGLLEDTLFVIYGDHDMGALHTEKTLPQVGPLAYTVAEDRVPFVVVIPGEEDRIARYGAEYTDATGGLHDVFPTILHLLGEPVPSGILGTNLLVPDRYRDPVPLPVYLGDVLFAHRHAIHGSRGSGPIDPSDPDSRKEPDNVPSLRDGVRDQFIVRDLLDHPEYWKREELKINLVDSSRGF